MPRILKSNVQLGKRIKKLRKDIGWTQEEIAEKLDISTAYYGHVEQGRKMPSMELLQEIAKILKVKVHDLIPFSYKDPR